MRAGAETRPESRALRSELCWFAATSAGVMGFGYVIAVIDATAASALSAEKILLLVCVAGAFLLTAILAAAGYCIDRKP
jgi:hypothetical protein